MSAREWHLNGVVQIDTRKQKAKTCTRTAQNCMLKFWRFYHRDEVYNSRNEPDAMDIVNGNQNSHTHTRYQLEGNCTVHFRFPFCSRFATIYALLFLFHLSALLSYFFMHFFNGRFFSLDSSFFHFFHFIQF